MIWELRHEFKITVLIEVSGLPRSSYYYYAKQKTKPDKYATKRDEIRCIYEENKGRYGYRRITYELHNRGICINHKTVQRLMRKMGLFCRVRMKKYNSYKGGVGRVAPNLLERNFKADKPFEKLTTDVTEFSLFGKKLYLSPVLDLYNGELIAFSLSEHPNFRMIVEMLEKLFTKLPTNAHPIVHSDQGWQYQQKRYQNMLADRGTRQSMSRKGNCLDNAVIENFFGHLKSELLYLQDFESIEHFKKELVDYLDYYNNRRIKHKLGGMSPVQYRMLNAA